MTKQTRLLVSNDNSIRNRISSLITFHRLRYIYDLLFVLVIRDIKLRYRRSIVGIGWSLVNPLAELLILGFVFGKLLSRGIPNYQVFLFTGLLAWNWFRGALNGATGVIVSSAQLVKLPGVPLATLPIATVTTHFVHYIIALPILILFILLDNLEITSAIIAAPLVMGIQFIFTLSLGYFLASVQVNYRDTQYILGITLRLGFFVSGIFYDPATIDSQYQMIFRLNPISILITAYRTIFLEGVFPDPRPLTALAILSAGMLIFGLSFFNRASQSFAEEI